MMKEILNSSSEYFDKYFKELGFKRKRKWNYIIPSELGFMKGVYLKPYGMRRGEQEFFPIFTIQHDAIGKIVWNGLELIRYKKKGVLGTSQYKFHDTHILTTTFAKIINSPSGNVRCITDYRFDNNEEALRVCALVCNDFKQNKDKFYKLTNTPKNIFKVMDFGHEPYIYSNRFNLMATYLYLEMDEELSELIERIERDEENASMIILKDYIKNLRDN